MGGGQRLATSPFGRKMSRVEALEAGGSKVDPLEGLDYALDNPNVRCGQQSNLVYHILTIFDLFNIPLNHISPHQTFLTGFY